MDSSIPLYKEVILIGFSVVEHHGIDANVLLTWSARSSIKVTRYGFGAHLLRHLPHLLDIIMSHRSFDDCLLLIDISTPGERHSFLNDRRSYTKYMVELMYRLIRSNSYVGFLHFYRASINYKEVDEYVVFIDSIAERFSIRCFNIGLDIAKLVYQDVFKIEEFLKDDVHPTAFGSVYYASTILEIIKFQEFNKPRYDFFDEIIPDYLTVPLSGNAASTVIISTRHGIEVSFAELFENSHIEFETDDPIDVICLLSLVTPDSGYLELIDQENNTKTIECFDLWSYYPHLLPINVNIRNICKLKISTSPNFPKVTLADGKFSDGARRNLVSHVFAVRAMKS